MREREPRNPEQDFNLRELEDQIDIRLMDLLHESGILESEWGVENREYLLSCMRAAYGVGADDARTKPWLYYRLDRLARQIKRKHTQ